MPRACCRCSTCPIRSARFTSIRSKLYGELEAETGQHAGFSKVSNIRLARTPDRWDEFMYYAGIAETIGVKVNILTPAAGEGHLAAVRDRRHHRRHPASGRRLYPARRPDAGDGQGRARARCRNLSQHRPSPAIEQKPNGEWIVKTDQGDITCEHVVSCLRQLRPQDRRHGRPRYSGHPRRAPVYRHRAASADQGTPGQGPAGNGRAARGRFELVHARGKWRAAARTL